MANPEKPVMLATAPVSLPRVTVKFCTQCKWMLRAAYFAQELLSTFSTGLGEVALIPGTGGIFVVEITHETSTTTAANGQITTHWRNQILWDRKAEGGFPEVKELKKRVRDIIDPSRDLGHVDRTSKATTPSTHPNTGSGGDPIAAVPKANLSNANAQHSPNPNPIPSSSHATKSLSRSTSRSGSNALPPAPGTTTLGRVASQRTHARGGSKDIGGGGSGFQGQSRDMDGAIGKQRSATGLEDEDSAAAAAEVRAALGGLGG